MPEPFVPIVPVEFSPYRRWVRATFRLFGAQAPAWLGLGLLALLFLGPFAAAGTASGILLLRAPASPLLRGINLCATIGLLLVTAPVMAGLTHAALRQLRGETISPRDFFRAGYAVPPLLLATLLGAAGVLLACACLLIPGVILGGLLLPVAPLIVDRRAGALGAIALAARIGRQHPALFGGYYLLWLLLHLLGTAVVLGIALTLPLLAIAQAVAFYDLYEGLPTYGGYTDAPDGPYTPPIPPYQPPPG